jgi:hypothetical protein
VNPYRKTPEVPVRIDVSLTREEVQEAVEFYIKRRGYSVGVDTVLQWRGSPQVGGSLSLVDVTVRFDNVQRHYGPSI